jgi:hypothetical protein
MDLVIAILSWVVTVMFPLLVVSQVVNVILEKVKSDWRQSKEQGVYGKVQLGTLCVSVLCLLVLIVLMLF